MPGSEKPASNAEDPFPGSSGTVKLHSSPSYRNGNGYASEQKRPDTGNIFTLIRSALKGRPDSNLRDAIEEYIGTESEPHEDSPSVDAHEKALFSNILKLRDMTVVDVMIPRADIVGIDVGISQEDLLRLLSEKQFSRLPVYQDTLDDVLGTIHIKDIMGVLARGQAIVIRDLIRDVPIVSPSLHVLDLLWQMRETRKHMAMVVDEFGGIDGLVTIGDVLEAIIGQIEDEHDPEQQADLTVNADGSVVADGRYDLEEFESQFGEILEEEEREDNDTLGGLVTSMAGRVPVRGEVLSHPSGAVFEVLDADPRRVRLLKITNLPDTSAHDI